MSSVSFCPTCGRPATPGHAFCVWCGAAYPGGAAPAAAYAAPAPYYPPPAVYASNRADFSRIFTGLFSVWGKDASRYVGLFILVSLVSSAVSALTSYVLLGDPYASTGVGGIGSGAPLTSARLGAYLAWIAVVAAVGLLVGSLVGGGVAEFAVRRHRGESPRFQESLRRGLPRFPSVLGGALATTGILLALVLAPIAILLAGAYSLAGTPPGAFPSAEALAAICGALLLLPVMGVVALYLSLSLVLTTPSIMMEGLRAVDGLRRSWRLTRGHLWSLFGVLIVLSLLYLAIVVVEGAILVAFPSPFVQIPFTAALAGFTGSWSAVMAAVAYDLILRETSAFAVPPPYMPAPVPPV